MDAATVANQFFKVLMSNQCQVAWSLFSKATQKHFLEWTLKDIYARTPEAAESAQLGISEIKLMFERNDLSLTKNFWKHFLFASNSLEIYRYGYFSIDTESGGAASVLVELRYPDGKISQMKLQMVKEKFWRLGFYESGLRLN